MIGVVCLNPALDITHHVPLVDWAGVNRPRQVATRPGGKGVNVARTLLSLGAEVLVIGLAGGATGEALTAGLAAHGVPSELTPIAAETRRTFAVLDEARRTVAMFNEPGPQVRAAEFAEFLISFNRLLTVSEALVLSGSLPPGLPADTYATLIKTAGATHAAHLSHTYHSSHKNSSDHSSPTQINRHFSHGAGVPVVLDAHGAALRLGAAAGPAVVKPNLAELEDLAGGPLSLAGEGTGRPTVASAAADLRAAGAESVVVSLGPAGLYADTPAGSWRAASAPVEAANPTGAGDAVTAGLALGLVRGQPWPDRLRAAVALGAAAVLAPVAGEFHADDYRRIVAGVTLNEVSPARYGSAERAERGGHAVQGNGDAG
ncbi:MAG TPA: PfkB family carbohydrate kinase [Streptosporangiaceae bacterium]